MEAIMPINPFYLASNVQSCFSIKKLGSLFVYIYISNLSFFSEQIL